MKSILLFISLVPKVFSYSEISSSSARIQDINDNEINYFSSTNDRPDYEIVRPLTKKDFENGRKLNYEQIHSIDPTDSFYYNKNLFEGDIVIAINSFIGSRNAVKGTYLKWRNGRIPYSLSNEYTEENKSVIARAFENYHNRTCVRFVAKRWTDFSYLYIHPGLGCASQVGKVGGKQLVSLGAGCLKVGIIEHELMHVLGFWHEQSRADRDDYIRINWENVEKGMEGNFVKFTWNEIESLDEEYDYGSVMHYGTHAFSRGFGSTLSPLKEVPEGVVIGQRVGMSETDIRKVNKLYSCKNNEVVVDSFITSLIDLITGLVNNLK